MKVCAKEGCNAAVWQDAECPDSLCSIHKPSRGGSGFLAFWILLCVAVFGPTAIPRRDSELGELCWSKTVTWPWKYRGGVEICVAYTERHR